MCTTLACYSILFSLDATCFCEKWERWPFENIIAEPTHIFLFLLPLAICSKVSFNNKMFQAGDRRHIFLTAFLNNVCTIKAKTIVAFFRKWGRRVRYCFRSKSNPLKSVVMKYWNNCGVKIGALLFCTSQVLNHPICSKEFLIKVDNTILKSPRSVVVVLSINNFYTWAFVFLFATT